VSCCPDGTGWMYVSNAELSSSAGDASAVTFGSSVSIADAYRILSNTTRNCAGGATPLEHNRSDSGAVAAHVTLIPAPPACILLPGPALGTPRMS
jgi:hypothetical protein